MLRERDHAVAAARLGGVERLVRTAQQRGRAFVGILGDDQAQRLAQAGAQISDLMVLFAAWQKASGLEPGESAASTGS